MPISRGLAQNPFLYREIEHETENCISRQIVSLKNKKSLNYFFLNIRAFYSNYMIVQSLSFDSKKTHGICIKVESLLRRSLLAVLHNSIGNTAK